MTHGNRAYLLLAAAMICGSMAIADQIGLPDLRPERQQTAALGQDLGLRVGERLNPRDLHMIQRPGLYGISQSPEGSAYGVVQGRLIRFDPGNLQVQSIIREVDRILD